MNNSTRRILSLALASTIAAGVPVSAKACDKETATIVYGENNKDRTYIVREGDTLGYIAQMFFGNAAYYEKLAEYNCLEDANKLSIGQVIKIPNDLLDLYNCEFTKDESVKVVYEDDLLYTVNEGDTLYNIVNMWYGIESREFVDKLATYNNLSDPNIISVGQVLLMPCLEKLRTVIAKDYTQEYNMMNWKLYYKSLYPWYGKDGIPFCEFQKLPPKKGPCKILKP